MACDRPLAKLDPDMGGFIPGPHMPISVTTEPSKNNGVVVSLKDGAGGRAGAARKGPPPTQHSRTVVHAQQPRSGLPTMVTLSFCLHYQVMLTLLVSGPYRPQRPSTVVTSMLGDFMPVSLALCFFTSARHSFFQTLDMLACKA